MSTKPKQATKPYTTTNKILNILGIIILAFVPQFLIDAYKDIQAEWTKSVSKPAPKKKAQAKKAAAKKQVSQLSKEVAQIEPVIFKPKRVRKPKEQPVATATAPVTAQGDVK